MGRPKKITPEIRSAIIRLHRDKYSLRRISELISISRNISLSTTAIKYTIDDHEKYINHLASRIIFMPEKPIIHRIQMVIPGITPDSLIQHANKHMGERALPTDLHNVKIVYIKSPPLDEVPDVNSDDVSAEKK